MEREVVTHRTHKKSTQSSQSDAVSRRVKGSLVWLPEELPLNWTVCVRVCVCQQACQADILNHSTSMWQQNVAWKTTLL